MINVNFLPEKKVQNQQEEENKKKLLVVALGLAVLVAVATIGALTISLFFKARAADLVKQKQTLTAAIENDRDKIQAISRVHRKVLGIKYILSSQYNYSPAFKAFFQMLPNGATLKSVSIDNKGAVSSSLTGSSSATLKDLVSAITSPERKYSDIQLGGISSDGKSQIQLSLQFVTANAKQ